MSHSDSNKLIIRLNAQALEALFPEGTEARVQLQNAVLTQAASQYVKGQLSPEVQKYLDAAVSKVAAHIDLEQQIARAFARKQGWNAGLEVRDGSHMAEAIAVRVRDEFSKRHAEHIDKLVKQRAALILETLDQRIEQAINAEVVRVANKRIQERVQLALNTAIQTIDQPKG
jgi:hypothetical protein